MWYRIQHVGLVCCGWVMVFIGTTPQLSAEQLEIPNEALTRGPLHEAFAVPYSPDPKPGLLVRRAPPVSFSEIPPQVAPTGDNQLWVSGYWGWDDDSDEFFWVSGIWRRVPPGRMWVPGYWAKVPDGHQWISGFWTKVDGGQLSYLPFPPRSKEQGPVDAAPTADQVWIPGGWRFDDIVNEYQWEDGEWTNADPRWTWVADRYVWTPSGALFVPGYWDYPLDERGVLFASMKFQTLPSDLPQLSYTPSIVIQINTILLHMFVNLDHCHYYYGDYYGGAFINRGYRPWCEHRHRHLGYDPLLMWHQANYARRGHDFVKTLVGWNDYFLRHDDMRPPHTYVAQREFVARHRDLEHVRQIAYSEELTTFAEQHKERLQPISESRRRAFQDAAGKIQQLTEQRTTNEQGNLKSDPARQSARPRAGTLKFPKLPDNTLRSQTQSQNEGERREIVPGKRVLPDRPKNDVPRTNPQRPPKVDEPRSLPPQPDAPKREVPKPQAPFRQPRSETAPPDRLSNQPRPNPPRNEQPRMERPEAPKGVVPHRTERPIIPDAPRIRQPDIPRSPPRGESAPPRPSNRSGPPSNESAPKRPERSQK